MGKLFRPTRNIGSGNSPATTPRSSERGGFGLQRLLPGLGDKRPILGLSQGQWNGLLREDGQRNESRHGLSSNNARRTFLCSGIGPNGKYIRKTPALKPGKSGLQRGVS